jgi:hypothetical protein
MNKEDIDQMESSLSFSDSLKMKKLASRNWPRLEKNPRDSIKSFL